MYMPVAPHHKTSVITRRPLTTSFLLLGTALAMSAADAAGVTRWITIPGLLGESSTRILNCDRRRRRAELMALMDERICPADAAKQKVMLRSEWHTRSMGPASAVAVGICCLSLLSCKRAAERETEALGSIVVLDSGVASVFSLDSGLILATDTALRSREIDGSSLIATSSRGQMACMQGQLVTVWIDSRECGISTMLPYGKAHFLACQEGGDGLAVLFESTLVILEIDVDEDLSVVRVVDLPEAVVVPELRHSLTYAHNAVFVAGWNGLWKYDVVSNGWKSELTKEQYNCAVAQVIGGKIVFLEGEAPEQYTMFKVNLETGAATRIYEFRDAYAPASGIIVRPDGRFFLYDRPASGLFSRGFEWVLVNDRGEIIEVYQCDAVRNNFGDVAAWIVDQAD
jgi:hypothetical protein